MKRALQLTDDLKPSLVEMTADVAAAYVANNDTKPDQVAALIQSIHDALSTLNKAPAEPEEAKPQGAVTARKSLSNPDHILSMIDGKPYASLKRHITKHGYTPESYREAFGLPAGYPMVAKGYSEKRRALAKEIGLGRRKKDVTAPAPAGRSSTRRTLKPSFASEAAEQS